MLEVCPTVIVRAPALTIWPLVATPRGLERWVDSRIVEAPDRELIAGDRLTLSTGFGHLLKIFFDIGEVVPPRRIALRVRLPFGVTNDEVIDIAPIDERSCRVTFN